jgi:hypothetical protein
MSDLPSIERFVSTRAQLRDGSAQPEVPEAATEAVNRAVSQLSLVRVRRSGVRRIDAWTHGGASVVHDLHPTDASAGMCFAAEYSDSQLAILWSSLMGGLSASTASGLDVRISWSDLAQYKSMPEGVQTVVVATLETPSKITRVVTVQHELGTGSGVTADDQSEVDVEGVGALQAWARVDSLLWDWKASARL